MKPGFPLFISRDLPFLEEMLSAEVPESRYSLGRPWMDAAFAGALLTLLNLFLASDDPGWLSVNPSPWVLLPLLAGVRYGFRWGFSAGAAGTFGVCLVMLVNRNPLTWEHGLFFIALPAIGLIAGEAHHWIVPHAAASVISIDPPVQEGMPAQFGADRPVSLGSPGEASPLAVRIAREADGVADVLDQEDQEGVQDQEDRRYAADPVSDPDAVLPELSTPAPATLHERLRGLFEPGAGPVFPHLLQLLSLDLGVTDAALYEIEGDVMNRRALCGGDTGLPESLNLSGCGIAQTAVRRNALVTCRKVLSTVPTLQSPWLAALPWPDPAAGREIRYLLLIRRMEPSAMQPENLGLIQLVCRWTARIMEWRGLEAPAVPTAGPLLVEPAIFHQAMALAAAGRREHQLPFATARFELAADSTPAHTARLQQLIAPQLRTTDLATSHPDGSIEILLSFDEPEQAATFSRTVHHLVNRDALLHNQVTVPIAPESTSGEPEADRAAAA